MVLYDEKNAADIIRLNKGTRSNKRKKIRIVNRARFLTMLLMVIVILVIIFINVINLVHTDASVEFTSIEVEVREGDTLWDLALRHNSTDRDVREIIYEIETLNNIGENCIKPGDILEIPII